MNLQCRHVFGINADVKGNISFMDDDNYVYTSGENFML